MVSKFQNNLNMFNSDVILVKVIMTIYASHL